MARFAKLDKRLRFEVRAVADDGHGNEESGDWTAQFTVWVKVRELRGGESVIADRLSGKTPAILTVRDSSETRQIIPEWRAVDVNSGAVWNVREDPREADNAGYLDFLAEKGVVT
ncbi:Phage head-tail joining protein [Labrenzia sp. THAF191b]|uniref:head-tail adaptor protein n=1 Tax=unclassified Labrenzia TaxID=2648686 RepID=UPI001267C1C4|nr:MULTISPECIES: head-tail adaptor protein [unclassified Labrenzia]QFT00490.1 Phage head-tail joining protein [Labrenzia sp. THAF191b]QFT06803.1 Phage head-tail joining protein [Labrenzia sp. THAF191a]QFT18347.1 Phage head-tail joining protein [Labrenzia sp. THAF187b]